MINLILKKVFGTKNERELKTVWPIVEQINALEASIKPLTDADLKAKTAEFKQKLANGATLDDILPEAFAVVREAGWRSLGMRHFDVQMVGGVVLHRGKITEMRTGEGKTLVATLPVYLNALAGKGVHVVTVNDYLARRDAEWMGNIYRFLGMSVGSVLHGLDDYQRKAAYGADITYGTNNEFGFDYLRDNMKFTPAQFVQRELNFAIVDEVDSILIDEARTPLIISGAAEQSTQLYYTVNQLIPSFVKEEDYTVDEKSKSIVLTDAGVAKAEKRLKVDNLYDPKNINLLHHVNQGLRAHVLFKRDVDYVIKDGEVVIVDEFTGRLMPGRRWSDGLHQAVEAKEGVRIANENQTLATITFQNYFRMYKKLAGMTGTADTEAEEFAKIYNLDVVVCPTNMPMVRDDEPDVVYKTEAGKFRAVIEEIRECHSRGQPVLVGTISIDKSERLAAQLKRHGVMHNVLNAKNHEREAEIIAQAGRKGAVTISTNMAGRGVDIVLGGNPVYLAKSHSKVDTLPAETEELVKKFKVQCEEEKKHVIAAGGLRVMGTERHESRRIDNQLRGRAGRQGDPGSSLFFLSLEDDLLRVFGGDRIKTMMDRLGMTEDEEIQHPWLSKAIANAQRKVEEHNFSIRKHVLEYDDVMNSQRSTVYGLRREVLHAPNVTEKITGWCEDAVGRIIDELVPEKLGADLDMPSLREKLLESFGINFSEEILLKDARVRDDVGNNIFDAVMKVYNDKREKYGAELMDQVEKFILLQDLDNLWKEHLLQMDHLKEGVSLRGYAQKDPLVEYKKEGFAIFAYMMGILAEGVVSKVMRVQIKTDENVAKTEDLERSRAAAPVTMGRAELNAFAKGPDGESTHRGPITSVISAPKGPKAGRNDPCPCGSGKKYKKCCGA